MDRVVGLTDPELTWWNGIRGSALLLSKTVADFLDRENAAAQGKLLRLASRRGDGTYTIDVDESEVLAATLDVRLRRGVLPWSEGVPPCRSSRGLNEPFLATPPSPPTFPNRGVPPLVVSCTHLGSVPPPPYPPPGSVRCARAYVTCSFPSQLVVALWEGVYVPLSM